MNMIALCNSIIISSLPNITKPANVSVTKREQVVLT